MEHLYNPDQMSEQEIKATFVARQALLDRLVALVRRQPDGAGVQHVVLVAPRGMGKTTMLLMVQFAATDQGLDPPWLALRFPEELYGVTDLADFWLETLAELSHAAGDPSLTEKTQQIKARYPDGDTLQEAALTLLREWCRTHGRRLLLLVDNFHQILAALDEQQAAALRNVLMNEGFLMILGAAPSFFKEASNYDEPLYNFFKVESLERLTFDDMRALLLQRAAADGLTDFEKNLDANTFRLRALEYFTGGNVRLVLMLYRVVAQSALLEVRQGLDKLLDQVTPFYKAKTEDLPPQQRKILDHIARTGGQSREGASPSEIASAVRLTPQLVSAQLKRLADAGYVQSANLRGRSASYTLSEPLYSLWYQMRFGRDARQRMAWLVDFLQGFYTAEELGEESRFQGDRFQTLLSAGQVHEARGALKYRRWLVEAMPDRSYSAPAMESVIQGYLTLRDIGALKEFGLTDDQLQNLSPETLDQLVTVGCLTAERAAHAQATHVASHASQITAKAEAALPLAIATSLLRIEAQSNLEQALANFDRALALDPQKASAWYNRGVVLDEFGWHDEAVVSYDRVLGLNPQEPRAWYNRGNALGRSGRLEEALASYDRALNLDPQESRFWEGRGVALDHLNRIEEALASYDRALALDERNAHAWHNKGIALRRSGRDEEALASYDQALALDPQEATVWHDRGIVMDELGRHEAAVTSYSRALMAVAEQDMNSKARIHLSKFESEMALGRPALAAEDWYAAAKAGGQQDKWVAYASRQLLTVAQRGHGPLVRELIANSNTEGQFFPLARALDYLATGDEALIEKLTPEMRPIVEAVVASLRPASERAGETPPPAVRRRKRPPAPKRKL